MGAVEQAWRESGYTSGQGGIRLARWPRAGVVVVNDATLQEEALAPLDATVRRGSAAGPVVSRASRNSPSGAG